MIHNHSMAMIRTSFFWNVGGRWFVFLELLLKRKPVLFTHCQWHPGGSRIKRLICTCDLALLSLEKWEWIFWHFHGVCSSIFFGSIITLVTFLEASSEISICSFENVFFSVTQKGETLANIEKLNCCAHYFSWTSLIVTWFL